MHNFSVYSYRYVSMYMEYFSADWHGYGGMVRLARYATKNLKWV